jgi:hypothetical protein
VFSLSRDRGVATRRESLGVTSTIGAKRSLENDSAAVWVGCTSKIAAGSWSMK